MIEPRRATVPVTINVPWEIAALIVEHGPALIQALAAAVRVRDAVVVADTAAKSETDAACDAQRLAWQSLANDVMREVSRRSNRPGQRRAIVRQIAAERGMKVPDLERILRVFTKNGKVRPGSTG